MEILEHHTFRLTRNEDVVIEEDETENLIQALEAELLRRRFGPPIRLEITEDMDEVTLSLLLDELDITENDVYRLPAPLDLRGLFRGPQAAEDAALVGSLCGELADELEWDGLQSDPLVKTAIAIDELRQRARELRCRGVSIGARQPAARDAIARHLEDKVGTAGGPITPEQRSTWVAAFRDIERAADNVVR
jgi:hypothetical protein